MENIQEGRICTFSDKEIEAHKCYITKYTAFWEGARAGAGATEKGIKAHVY